MTMKYKGILSLTVLLLSTSGYSSNLASRHYEFAPNQAIVLANPFPWQLNMNCNLSTTADKNMLSTVMLKATGTVNGHPLNEGDHVNLEVKNQDHLTISVAVGAQVQITNQGTAAVTANCEL